MYSNSRVINRKGSPFVIKINIKGKERQALLDTGGAEVSLILEENLEDKKCMLQIKERIAIISATGDGFKLLEKWKLYDVKLTIRCIFKMRTSQKIR